MPLCLPVSPSQLQTAATSYRHIRCGMAWLRSVTSQLLISCHHDRPRDVMIVHGMLHTTLLKVQVTLCAR